MAFNIDTSSAIYQTNLTNIQTAYALVRQHYGPVVFKMTKAQLIQLYQRDELFKELIDMAKDLNRLAEKVEVDL